MIIRNALNDFFIITIFTNPYRPRHHSRHHFAFDFKDKPLTRKLIIVSSIHKEAIINLYIEDIIPVVLAVLLRPNLIFGYDKLWTSIKYLYITDHKSIEHIRQETHHR